MSDFFPEQTIRYKTYAKRTLVEGLTAVFQRHPDALLQRTRATIEFPKTQVEYPSVVVRFYEREIFNAGVGHDERVFFAGESDSVEVSVILTETGSVTLHWDPIHGAAAYRVYRGRLSNQESQVFEMTETKFVDNAQTGTPTNIPTTVTASLDTPDPTPVVSPEGTLPPGEYFYRVTAVLPQKMIRFKHYFYTADVEFAVYALSAYDRDLVADSVVQTIAMGTLDAYTSTFYERIYPSNDLYPDAELHFLNINADQIQGFGESQSETPWGAEDALIYTTSYRVGVFGELYSLPPKVSYAMVAKIAAYPYVEGIDTPGSGIPHDDAPWVSNYI